MKRFISLLLSLIMIIGIMPSNSIAAPTAGETLKSMGLLTGDQYGNLNENQYLTRAEMMVVLARMLGEYNQAYNYTKKSNFTDGNNHWAERYVAYAQYRGWTVGIGNNEFGYEDRHTVQEASVFMLKALGYVADIDFTWNTAYNKAVQLDLFSSTSLKAGNNILRGDLFTMMLKTIYTKVKGLNVTLGEVLNVTPPTSANFEVKSINATSLKEIIVTFSKSLDKTTVNNSDFSIPGYNLTASVLSDGYTVSLIADGTFSNMSQYTLSIDNIRSADGSNLSAVSKTFVVNDTTAPKVTNVKPLGTSTIEITFSEPIKTIGNVTVNSPSLSMNISNITGVGSSKINIQLSSLMTNGVSYSVTARDFQDYANNTSTAFYGSMLFQPDTSPITAKALSADQVSVAFEFNRPVRGITASHFYHTYASWTPLGIYKDSSMTQYLSTNEEVSVVYVKFASLSGTSIVGNQLPTGAVNVTIKEYNETGMRIIDSWNNAFAGGTYLVNVTVDTTKPTVTKLEMSTATTVAIEFSENVNFGKSNLSIQYSTGSAIPDLSYSVSGSGRSYTVKMNDLDLSGASLKFTITNVSDYALIPNTLTSYTKTLTVPDLVDPFVVEIVKDPSRPALLVQYSEKMGSSALSRSNYEIRVGTTKVSLTKTPINFYSNQVIRIELTDSEFAYADSSAAYLWISGVKDVAGNTIATKTYRLSTTQDISETEPVLLDVKATERNIIIATFDQKLMRADAGAFKIVIDGKEYSVSTPTLETNSSDQTIVTLKPSSTSGYLPYDTALSDLKITTTSTYRVQNIYGVNVSNTIEAIRDNIKPAINKFTSAPNTGKDMILRNGNTIEITFTEDLNPDYVTKETFTVSRATVTDATLTGNVVMLTINPADNMLSAPTLTMRTEVRDLSGNRFRDTRTLQSINVTP